MRWTTNPWQSGKGTNSHQNDCFTSFVRIRSASETASRAQSINFADLTSRSMTHQSGLLLLRAQDATVAIAFASRFALVCIANFAFGFGAGYLYAQYRNICVPGEEDNHTASESDKVSVTQGATATSEEHSTIIVSDSVVEEQNDSLEQASRKFLERPQSEAEPKSPPGTPVRSNEESITAMRVLSNPEVESCTSETLNNELQYELEHLTTAQEREEEHILPTSETTDLEPVIGEEQRKVRVTGLQIQPIHGCPPQSVNSLKLTQHGVENHLMYAVSDFTGRYISHEKVPSLSEVIPTILENGHLRLSGPSISTVTHEPKFWGQKMKITIQGVQYEAVDQGDSVSQVFAKVLEIPGVRLLLIRPPPISNRGHRLFRTWPTADRPLLLISEEKKASVESIGSIVVGTNLVISASESDLSSSTVIKIDDHLFEIMKVPSEASSENIPTHHLLGGGEALVPIDLERRECVLRRGQTVVIMKSDKGQHA
ncbi:MOSC beta barrel [Gracilaria domingensis]|nr:MOSC beta barrel [Gracilaria domingensis]